MKLSKQEQQWIAERRVTRLSDNKEVQIYPMGAERYLWSVLHGQKKGRYDIKAQIADKDVLVIPGYGNSSFLFAQAGAKSITVYDKDPVTIAWMKVFKRYYHYREYAATGHSYPSIGELFAALTCWYPPLMLLPEGGFINRVCWVVNPQLLRRNYIFYMLALARQALAANIQDEFELEHDIQFYAGEIDTLRTSHSRLLFDTAFVPYLLGVRNGIESVEDIIQFVSKLIKIVPKGQILVNPSRDTKEFYVVGKRYFETTAYSMIHKIPGLHAYLVDEDRYWFRTQGLAVFSGG